MVRIKRRMVNITGIIIFTGSDLKDKGIFFESESDNFIFPVKGMQISIVKVSWDVKNFTPMLLKNDNHSAPNWCWIQNLRVLSFQTYHFVQRLKILWNLILVFPVKDIKRIKLTFVCAHTAAYTPLFIDLGDIIF